jgi:hypothetical protein
MEGEGMSCPSFEEEIAHYVGGDLAQDEALAVEQHLRNCAGCAELAGGLQDDREWLASRPPEAVAMDFAALRRQIRQEIRRPRPTRRWLPALVAAAAILAVWLVATNRRTPSAPRLAPADTKYAGAAPLPDGRGSTPDAPPKRDRKKRELAGGAACPTTADTGLVFGGAGGASCAPRAFKASGPIPPQTDLTLEAAMRMFQQLNPEAPPPPAASDSPVEMQIATRDPNVTIILVQEANGDSR